MRLQVFRGLPLWRFPCGVSNAVLATCLFGHLSLWPVHRHVHSFTSSFITCACCPDCLHSFSFWILLLFFSEHLGCYKISAENRVFVSSPGDYDMEDISPLHCLRQCGRKYRYATLQEGNVCLCANTLPTAGQVNGSECNMTCPGHDSWPINDKALRWEKLSWSFIFRRFPCSLWRFCDCERKNQRCEGRRFLRRPGSVKTVNTKLKQLSVNWSLRQKRLRDWYSNKVYLAFKC